VSLRLRVAFAAAVAVLVTILASSVALYFGVRQHLYDQVDASMSKVSQVPGVQSLEILERAIEAKPPAAVIPSAGAQPDFLQFVDASGRVVAHVGPSLLPVTAAVRSVARGERPDVFFNTSIAGSPERVYALHLDNATAFEIGHPLDDVTSALHDLLVVSAVVTAGGVAVAVLIGGAVAFAALRPVRRMSAAVQAVAATGELSHHVEVSGHDELAQMAAGFNAMLDALDESLGRQRRLVADASHVLRTPLATVRTNVEVLRRAGELDTDDRDQLIRDTVTQTAELTRLVNNLIELARGEEELGAFGAARLDELVASVVSEARRNYPSVRFELSTEPSIVWASPDRLAKAVGNLVDNAAKWTKPSTPVEVTAGNRSVTVRDHGPGVDPADASRIFDRFYRSLSARGIPGSGLGLAIAKQAVEAHGGHIEVRNAVGGGAEFVVGFPPPPGR
jgi:two-component system, OmpR family, sensor histidine kinase MprB